MENINNSSSPRSLFSTLTGGQESRAFILSGSLLGFLLITSVKAADIENGKTLHNKNCVRCHQPALYLKEDRKVKNLKHLRSQVQFCEVSNDLSWFDEEVDDVTEYLNVNYYFFNLK